MTAEVLAFPGTVTDIAADMHALAEELSEEEAIRSITVVIDYGDTFETRLFGTFDILRTSGLYLSAAMGLASPGE